MSGYVANQPKALREAELREVSFRDAQKEIQAQYEKYGKKPARSITKVQVALRIGVFFDGTGNNASNSVSGLQCGANHPIKPADLDASCKPYMHDPDSSYGNDITNVRKLSELYYAPPEAEGDELHKRAYRAVYIEGIGTVAGAEDNLVGAGAGRGDTGVAARVSQAFKDIQINISRFHAENADCEIASLTFDIFGFSRGAASARHFANQVVLTRQGPLKTMLLDVGRVFSRYFVDQYQRDIHVGFIGLFDTVAAIGGLVNFGNVQSATTPGVNLYLSPKWFSDVVHLVARDEYRGNFALNSLGPDHLEISLPGAHSDIGGGYLAEAEECVLISPMQALDVSLHTDIETTSIYRDASVARTQWLEKGWPAEMLEVVTPDPVLLDVDPRDRLAPRRKRVYAVLQLKRPVRGELSRVYLRLMYELAGKSGVRFNPLDEYNPDYAVPAELRAMCERFAAGDYSTTAAEENLLRLRYIHTSAHWNPPARIKGNTPRTSVRLVFINAPTTDSIRVIHPHLAGREVR